LGLVAALIAVELSAAPPAYKSYFGLKGQVNFANHGYYLTDAASGYSGEKDDGVGFGQQIGFEANVGGFVFNRYRVQLDFGMLGKHVDKKSFAEPGVPNGLKFSETAYYATIGGIYSSRQTPWGGLYGGAGVGAAFIGTGLNINGITSDISLSPMGAVMFGYEKNMSGRWTLDLGAKVSGWYGSGQHYKEFEHAAEKVGIGFVWNVSMMLGARYGF
jgi:hypothetical protein